MFGRQAHLPVDIMFGTSKPESQSPNEYAAMLKKQLTQHLTWLVNRWVDNICAKRSIMIRSYMETHTREGTLHLSVVKRGQHRKLHHPWTGPYQVLKQVSEATYRIKQVDGKRQRKVVHFDRLNPCPSNIRVKDNTNEATNMKQKNVEQSSGSVDDEQVWMPSIGTNLQLIDYDDDDGNGQTLDTQQPTAVSPLPPPRRYPERHQQPPAHYNDFVPHS